ncbi:MAG: hypothetical protein JSU87_04190 [Gemmatimonadota bacterium]|nr:MAG: hypothetical protein JSU87_04190 [Gemmatimonadota bacterium]
MADPLNLLERGDKHYLGSGDGIIFAPRFPRWLRHPGFWDECDVHHYQIAPLFTVVFLDSQSSRPGRALPCRQLRRRWTPAELVSSYEFEKGLTGIEHRSLLPGGHFLSEWTLANSGDEAWNLLAVAWTVLDADGIDLSTVRTAPGSSRLRTALRDRHDGTLHVDVTLEAPGRGLAGAAFLSEGACRDPIWELTPFPEKWRHGTLVDVRVGGVSPTGLLYVAVASHLEVPPLGESPVTLRARLEPDLLGGPRSGRLPGLGVEGSASGTGARRAPRLSEEAPPGAMSRARWSAYFATLPELSCSDPFFERYWYYRWYGLRLCGHDGGVGNHVYPGCCEGTGYFHVPISYSAQCHARELRWLPDPDRARGVIGNFLAHQKEGGGLHGRIYVNHLEGTDFYFADWGAAVLAVDEVHPDRSFLGAVHQPLTRYAEWLDRMRDADRTGLYDVVDHFETGQEYMSRYLAVNPRADSETWGEGIRLKGIDATVYAYRLQRALAEIGGRLGDEGAAKRWAAAADRTATAILDLMWDANTGMFSDVDPRSLKRTGVKAAVCFYPYFTDLVRSQHIDGLRRHLLSPQEFWTPYPVPSTSLEDPYFSPDAEWKGKRLNCPWNGRVWPMTNSHVIEAIGRAAIDHDATLRQPAAYLIRRFVRMMFHDADLDRPNCYEHYNPETGRPSIYRGFDDYQHSWVNDLIVRYVAGFRPLGGDSFVVDPFPFELESLRLARLHFRGRLVDIEIARERVTVHVNGRLVSTSTVGETMLVEV